MMDEQKPKKRTRPSQQQQQAKEQKPKKDLLRLQRDIFQLKKSQQHESQYVIRKLMQKKQKPQISMIQQSPLLSRLKQMMPIFNKSNQQLQQQPIQQIQKIDVRLEQCQSSSSSQESQFDNQYQNHLEQINQQQIDQEEISSTINQTQQMRRKMNKMDIQHKKKNKLQKISMIHPFGNNNMEEQQGHNNIEDSQNNNNNFVQINFLTYPYLNQQQIDQLKTNNNNKTPTDTIQQHIKELVQKKKLQKKVLIQQINDNEMNV